jgi:broad specificity phosphatase PhoE
MRRRPIDAIYASPYAARAADAGAAGSHCPKPAVTKPEFREVDFGDWTGLTWEQVEEQIRRERLLLVGPDFQSSHSERGDGRRISQAELNRPYCK